jgi:5-methyltetrahydropteroyltriglutamate--homocysteine methyltransferase
MQRDIDNLARATESTSVTGAFLPVVAPASVSGISWDGVYSTEEEFLYAIADALRDEYRLILDAGLELQVDDAFIPWMYDLMVQPATLEDYRRWAESRVEILNHALRGLPQERIRYHICWGSWPDPVHRSTCCESRWSGVGCRVVSGVAAVSRGVSPEGERSGIPRAA